MARYGLDAYGAPTSYGGTAYVDFFAGHFIAKPYQHLQTRLTWDAPTGLWTRMRLVRNFTGWPDREDDGAILFDINSGPSATGTLDPGRTEWIDTVTDDGNPWAYYSLFVYGLAAIGGQDAWRRAGVAESLIVYDHGYAVKMLESLPTAFRTEPESPAAAGSDSSSDQLDRFIGVFGFDLDRTRSQADSLLHLRNPTKVGRSLLESMSRMVGVPYESAIGPTQQRRLLRNAAYLSQKKGTSLGIEGIASALTGWGAFLGPKTNLMLNDDHASFEQSIGTWVATANCTVARQVTGTPLAYANVANDNKQAAYLKVTATASATLSVRSSLATGGIPVGHGIPVSPSTAYTASIFSRTAVTSRNIQTILSWYDAAGVLISSAGGTPVANGTGAWTRSIQTATSPANAKYALVGVDIPSAVNGEIHYLDAVQLELGSSATAYKDARRIDITLVADRINQFTNPRLGTDATSWTSTAGTGGAVTAARQTGQTGWASAITTSYRATWTTATSAVSGGVGTVLASVVASTKYAVTVYVRSSKIQRLQLSVDWNTSAPAFISTSAATAVVVAANTVTKLTLLATSPVNAANASVWVKATSGTSGTNWAIADYLEATGMLVEKSDSIDDYFDGTLPLDVIWEGTPNASRTHYYRSLDVRYTRLLATLPKYTPLASTFSLLIGQAGT